MGTVYMAEQTERLRRTVALKLIDALEALLASVRTTDYLSLPTGYTLPHGRPTSGWSHWG
jgi:hypothetical protein